MNTEQFRQWCQLFRPTALNEPHSKPLIMGILNLTPDSFSDGGRYSQLHKAIERAQQMIEEGADLIDIGGESSKPGITPVSCEEELARVIPVIRQLRKETDFCLSIDTTKPEVMRAAVYEGVSVINNIKGFESDESLDLAAELDVPLCLMHMQGEPETMQDSPHYDGDIIEEINRFFQQRINSCLAAGIKRHNLILDPGFGFGKTVQHNMRIVHQLAKFQIHKLPVMLGFSRKSTLGTLLDKPVDKRLAGGVAITTYTAQQGIAMLRTHDIAETKQTLTVLQAIQEAGQNNKARIYR